MSANSISQTQQLVQDANNSVDSFFAKYKLTKILYSCRAKKLRGFSMIDIFRYLICMMFSPISTYMSMRIGSYEEPFSKNTIYRFCEDSGINWNKFVRLLAAKAICEFMLPATSADRKKFFIFDDTPYTKSGRKTELVSKFFNHVNMSYEYGYRILSMVWTDGYSNVPIDSRPLASGDQKLIRCQEKKCDKRSLAARTRKDAKRPAPDLIHEMIQQAKAAKIHADYVLFDSWFATPKGIIDIKDNLKMDVIAMIKKSSKVFFEYQGEQLNIKQIYARNKKRRGLSKYLLSVEINLIQKEKGKVVSRIPAKIVCVRNKANRKDWIALISTDTDLSEEDVIRNYSYRWNIELYFKACKQYLKMLSECRSTSFDALISHLAIVNVRYMILSVAERANSDERSLGELFWLIAEEVATNSFSKALQMILSVMLESVQEFFHASEEMMQAFLNVFISKLPSHLRKALQLCVDVQPV